MNEENIHTSKCNNEDIIHDAVTDAEIIRETIDRVSKTSSYEELFIRGSAFIIMILIVIADYLGHTSQYAHYVLGGAVVLYMFGKKGLLVLISKWSGYKITDLDAYLKS